MHGFAIVTHGENADSQPDANFRDIPLEGVGAGNHATGSFALPRFSDMVDALSAAHRTIAFKRDNRRTAAERRAMPAEAAGVRFVERGSSAE